MKLTLDTIDTGQIRRVSNALVLPDLGYGLIQSMDDDVHNNYLGGVYNENGDPVPEALSYRALHPTDYGVIGGPMQVGFQAPCLPPKEKKSGVFIYAGQLSKYIGHYFVDNLCRLWCAKDFPNATLVWTAGGSFSSVHLEILDLLGVENESLFIEDPTEFEELLIPSPGHIFPLYFTQYFLDFLRVVEPSPIVPGRKVFLARANKNLKGAYSNEDKMEDFLRANGWTIFAPEEVPFADRFEVLSSAEIVLGIEGASLLSYLFLAETQVKVYALSRSDNELFQNDVIFETYEFMARDVSLDYQRLSLPKEWVSGEGSWAKFTLDMDAFEFLLESTDFLSRPELIPDHFRVETPWTEEQTKLASVEASLVVDAFCEPVQAHQYEAERFAASGDWQQAIQEWNEAVALQPELAYLHIRLSRLYTQAGDMANAAKAMEQAIALVPPSYLDPVKHSIYPLLFSSLGALYEILGKMDESLELSKKVIELIPNSIESRIRRGHVLSRTGDLDGALECFEFVLEKDPFHVEANRRLMLLYAQREEWTKAQECGAMLIELDPYNAQIRFDYAVLFHRVEQYEMAEESYRRCLEMDKTNAGAHYQISHLLARKGEIETALHHSEMALQADANAIYGRHFATLLRRAGKSGEADAVERKYPAEN